MGITATYSGSDNYTRVTASYTFSIVQLAVNSSPIKKLIFSWRDVTDATYYKLLKVDLAGGMNTQVGQDVTASNTGGVQSITRIVPFYTSAGIRYRLESCDNTHVCTSSANNQTITQAQLNWAIGYIKASNADGGDQFGESLSLDASGDTLAVGATGEDSDATGVGGNQSDNSADNAGAVCVFSLDATTDNWSQQAYIKASNTGRSDEFGWSVSLDASGDTLAVGAYLEKSNATGIGGDQSNNDVSRAGAVYLY